MKTTATPTRNIPMVYLSDSEGNWACFYVNKWTEGRGFNLTIASSFGTWNTGWGGPGGGVTKFLRDSFDNLDYLKGKFCRGSKTEKMFIKMYNMFYSDFVTEYERFTHK